MLDIRYNVFTQWREVGIMNPNYTRWNQALQKKVTALDVEATLWNVHVLIGELQKMIPALPPKRQTMAKVMVEGMMQKMAEQYENRSVVRTVYAQAKALRKAWARYQ